MDRSAHSGSPEAVAFDVADNDADEATPHVPALRIPAHREVIEVRVDAASLPQLVAFVREHGAEASFTSQGELGLRFPDGGLIILTGTEGLAHKLGLSEGKILGILNGSNDTLAGFLGQLKDGTSEVELLKGQLGGDQWWGHTVRDEPQILGQSSPTSFDPTNKEGLSPTFEPLPGVLYETARWGRDDLKRGEAGERGQFVATETGTTLPHLVGLGDEDIGRRNGEKVLSSDNTVFPGVDTGVGHGIDHLWLLGDFEYYRASRDLEEGEDVFAKEAGDAKIWAPIEPLKEFSSIEDTPYGGQLFDPDVAMLPVTDRHVTMNPRFGTVTLGPDGHFDYTPAYGFSGDASFTYSFRDPRTGETVTGAVKITVAAVADPATISGAASTPEDVVVATPVRIDLNDPDGSEDIEKVVITGLPAGAVLDWNHALPGSITLRPDGSFLVTGTTADIKALMGSLNVTPPHDFHGEITLDIAVTTIERNVSPSLPGYLDRETTHFEYHIHVEAVADNVTATGDAETTDEDTLVHLNDLAATFGDSLDGSETHVVEIRGVDPDAKITDSTGTEYPFVIAGDGTKTYTLAPSDVGNVHFLPPKDESGTFAGMTIVAIATEGSNGDQEIATAPITVVVNPVADPVEITAPAQATDEDTPVTFGDDIDIVVNDPLTQDIIEVVVSGFPAGTVVTYTPVGGGVPVTVTMGAGGSVTLNGGAEAEIRAALATLTLTPPPNTDQNITLAVSATTEDLGGVTDTQTVPMTITVAAVADGPSLGGAASGNEDAPIGLPITSARLDADGSESYEFADITPPAGVTLTYPPVLPYGITVSVSGNTTTFHPGPSTTAAEFESFLATALKVEAPTDSDVNFDVTVKVGTIESVLSGGEVALLRADQTIAIPVTVHPVIDMPTVTGSSTVDEDTSVNFGADIAITANDKTDGSEAITEIVVSGLPIGATVSYTPVGGVPTTFTVGVGTTSITLSGGTEDEIRASLATLTLTPPLHSDANIPVTVTTTKVDQTTSEGEAAATQTDVHTHTITVNAVADGPTLSGSASGNEDQPIDLPIAASRIDADGSEQYDFATITPPVGVTLIYAPVLPNGITVSIAGNAYTFTPGPATTAAEFESFLATGLKVQAPADSDVNFDVTVKVGTIESVLTDSGLTLLRKDDTIDVPVAVHPVIDAPVTSGASAVNEDGILNPADQTVTAGVNFGANINITAPDSADGSEAITQIVVSGLPVGALVSYTPVGGAPTTFTVGAGTTSLTLSGGTDAEIRAALATLTLTPPLHSDADITLGIAVTKLDQTTSEGEAAATQVFNATHTITVAAIADVPTGSGSGAGLEDESIPVSISVGHPDVADGSETIKNVVIGSIPAGFTLSESAAGAGVLTLNGDGTYTVTGPTDAAINDVLGNLSLGVVPGGARQHLDTDFDLSVTVTTIESTPSETGAGQMSQLETSQTFNVPVTVTAVADGVTASGSSVIVEDVAKAVGTDIAFAHIDADGSEAVTDVAVSGFPVGSTVQYTDVGGTPHTVLVAAGGLTVSFNGGTEAEIRAALDTLTVTAPSQSDANFSLNVAITTADHDGSTIVDSYVHNVVVQAVADTPSVVAQPLVLNEDTTATLNINANSSADNGATDNTETLSVQLTVPSDGSGVVGTLTGTPPLGVTFTDQGGGVYTVTASGADPAAREALLDGFLGSGITFTPRAQWSGSLTGVNGIRVDVTSTEAASGAELAPGSYGGADNDSKVETATTYIDVTVNAVPDTPVLANATTTVEENTGLSSPSDPDVVIPIGTRLGLTIADTDGSESLSLTLTGFPTNAQALAFGSSDPGVTTNITIGTGTVTISGPAIEVLSVLSSLSATLADDDDRNFTVTVAGTATDTNGVTPVATPVSLTHDVIVQAVADTPTVNVGAATKATVDEDSGFVTYPVTTGLNDGDGSETYQSVVVEFWTTGAGTQPSLQFGTSTGVTINTGVAGQVTLTGAAADIDAAMATLQVKPGANNDADIHVRVTATAVETNPAEDNNGAGAGMGGGAVGPEITVPTAQSQQSFVIPVAAVADTPTGSGSGAGLEDESIPVSITVGHPDVADGSETIKNVVIGSIPAGFTLSESAAGAGVLTLNGDGTYTVTGPTDAAINDVLGNLSLGVVPGGARQHLDTDFDLSVTVTTIESTPSETGAGQGVNNEASYTFNAPVTVTAVADGVTKSGSSTIVEDVAKTIGSDIVYTRIDADGSENVTSVVVSGFPVGTAVTYTDMLGNPQSFVSTGTETITLSGPKSAATETAIRTALDSLNVTSPLNSDDNFSLNVSVTTEDNDGSTTTQGFTHAVLVQAVADTPSVTASPLTLDEDTTTTLVINPGRSPDDAAADNSETLSVRITVPSDGIGVIGTLTASPPAGVTFTAVGGGVYTVTATGATPADRETTLDAFLNGGVTFTPRAQWSGVLTGVNGIMVEAISTEAATGGEVAPGSYGGADGTSQTETVTTWIDVTVNPVNDMPVMANASTTVNENNNSTATSDPDLVVAIGTRLGLTIADTDGSQGLSLTLTGFPTNAQALAFGTTLAGVTTSVSIATGTVTVSGANASNVLTVLNSLSVRLADDRDENFTVSVTGTATDSNGVTVDSDPISLSHLVTVRAVADRPTVNVGTTPKPAVDEDTGFVTYPVTTALNDSDSSETYQSVRITFSTPGSGNRPELQFGTSTGVTINSSVPGQLTLTGAAADINAAMLTLQVKPGADNGEDITITVRATSVESNPAEDNNGASAGMGGGVTGPEISIATAQTTQTFVIPVNPVPETPTLTTPASASGTEDTKFSLGTITVTSGNDPDNSEARYFEIDTTSYPAGTQFFNGATAVGTVVTPGWLRLTEGQLTTLTIQPPANYSGTINLSVRGVIVDTTTSGAVTGVTATQALPVTVTPDADGIATPSQSVGVEDNGSISVGVDLANATTGIRVNDNGSGTGNNSSTETLSQVKLDFPDDTATQTYTITPPGTPTGSAQIAFDPVNRVYTITSTIITGAADVGALSQAQRDQAEADIRATLDDFTVTMGPTHTDLNGSVVVTATTLDVNGGLANTQDNTFTHPIVVQAVADTPTVSVVDPATAVAEDGPNVLLTINAGNSADADNSETLSVRITIPSDSLGPVGTLAGTPPAGVTVTNQGGGVYLVTATGADNATREALLDSFLNGGGAAFDPRANWSGSLTGASGIKVDVISTEAATGSEVAPGSYGGADGTSKSETVTDYIDILVAPTVDTPSVKGNGVGVEDTRIPIPMSVTLADKDGSESYIVRITGGVPSGAHIYGAGGAEILPDGGGVYTLTPADVAALAIEPPLHYSSPLSGDITLVTVTDVTDSSGASNVTSSFTTNVVVEVTGVADQPGTRTVNVSADEDEPIALGAAILTSAGGNLNNLLVDADGSEALSFVVGGLPQGVIPTSSVPGGVTYLGSGTWSITAAAMATLELPAVPNFSGTNPYSGVTVRAVTQELDGDQASSPQWPVTITVNPVIAAGTVDGFASWGMGVTQAEGANETGSDISLASVANHTYVDNDGSEAVVSYTFDLSGLIADAGIASQLAALDGPGADLGDLVANHITGTFTYNAAAHTITVAAADVGGVSIDGDLFRDSNDDFSIPVSAVVRDTAIIGGTPVTVDKSESGTFGIDLVGTADIPTAFASSVSGSSGTLMAVSLGGDSTDTDPGLGRTLSENIYYVVSVLNPGTAPAIGFRDAMGNVVGLDNGDGTWVLSPADLVGLHVYTAGGSVGTASLRLTTIATENDGDTASNSATFDVTVSSTPGGGGTPPLPPTVTIGTNAGNEDGSITLNVNASPAPGDTTNPSVAVMISNLPAGAQVIGARFNPDTGRWVASSAAVNSGAVQIIPPPDFSGVMNISIEAVATNAALMTATTGLTTVPIDVDPVADGVAISSAPDAGIEDVAIDLNVSLGERDTDGNEVIGGSIYVTLSDGATLAGSYPVVLAGDPDAVVDGVSLVGTYRVPASDAGTLQAMPAPNWHGTFNVTVRSYSTEPLDDADGDNVQLDTATIAVTVTADADAPVIAVPAVPVSGTEDTPITIPGLSAALADTVTTNGAEVLSVKITGVPDGSRFSAGSNNGDGSWTIPVAALGTLSITPPLNYSGTMTLTLTAIALELANGDEAQSSMSFDVVVTPTADTVEILAKNVAVDDSATAALDLNVRMADNTGTSPGENAPEQIQITFTSVPTGISLTATAGGSFTNPVAGTWVFTGTEAEANAIAAAAGETVAAGTYTLSLSAVTIDATDTLASPVTDSFQLVVPQVIAGGATDDSLVGGAGTQLLFGAAGNDTLNGAAGNDYLSGGTGNDSLVGSTGDDTYNVDSATDLVVEASGAGTDTVETSLASYILGIDVESLVFTGSGDFSGTGNGGANALVGGPGNDTLDGAAGADTMSGGSGNDIYIVDNAGDVVSENGGAGTDTVETTLSSFTLGSNLENLTFTGSGSFQGIGNSAANTIIGGASADTLTGGLGADTMAGGGGADTFACGSGDLGAGVDTVTDFVNGAGGDKIDISALLTGFNPATSVLTDFVQASQSGGDSTIRVDADGGGDSFQDLVILQGVTGLDVNTMRSNGNLIV